MADDQLDGGPLRSIATLSPPAVAQRASACGREPENDTSAVAWPSRAQEALDAMNPPRCRGERPARAGAASARGRCRRGRAKTRQRGTVGSVRGVDGARESSTRAGVAAVRVARTRWQVSRGVVETRDVARGRLASSPGVETSSRRSSVFDVATVMAMT